MGDDPVILTIAAADGGRAASLRMPRARAEAIVHELLGRCWPRFATQIEPIPSEADH